MDVLGGSPELPELGNRLKGTQQLDVQDRIHGFDFLNDMDSTF
ncbi:hypothetical protein AXXA_06178 [Achromobacter insuavis AXX-A]|uniref:Uncharacterized protein n=1 Tax=Achromobacter insuavis AXX-A TaxID=1003200 RepID=F7SWY0_9BURK|nr:hypothetical protein AXXA_06178 [Achromobacter insuavis AXX-A]